MSMVWKIWSKCSATQVDINVKLLIMVVMIFYDARWMWRESYSSGAHPLTLPAASYWHWPLGWLWITLLTLAMSSWLSQDQDQVNCLPSANTTPVWMDQVEACWAVTLWWLRLNHAHINSLLSTDLLEWRPGMSDFSPMSGILGLSLDYTLLSPVLFFCRVLMLLLSYLFFCLLAHSPDFFLLENSSIFVIKRHAFFVWRQFSS